MSTPSLDSGPPSRVASSRVRKDEASGAPRVRRPSTLDKIQAMEKQRLERRQQMEERKQEMKEEEKRNAELGVVGDADFVRMIAEWREAQPAAEVHEPFDCDAGGRAKGKELCICVRKRPIGRREVEKSDHDAVSCTNPAVVVHDCRHRVDGITKYLNNARFVFDQAFSESVHTDEVYACIGAPLVDFVVRRRGRATVFAYGQTGSGKTYTMEGIQRRAARDVFALLDNSVDFVGVSFFEIYGGRCQDLLRERARLQVREDGKGEVNVVDLAEQQVCGSEELLAAIERGNRLRTTQRTEANDASSRSHAVCQIVLRCMGVKAGKLSLVDLAGSERGADTRSHSRQLRTESAEINRSLLALKECIRSLATNETHVPFRASKLTMVLRDSFVRPHCRVAMIATVSPSVSATDHTINTLRYADRVKEKPSNLLLQRNNENSAPPPNASPQPPLCDQVSSSSPSPSQHNQRQPPRRTLEAARRSLDSRQGGRRGVRRASPAPAAASLTPTDSLSADHVNSSLDVVVVGAPSPPADDYKLLADNLGADREPRRDSSQQRLNEPPIDWRPVSAADDDDDAVDPEVVAQLHSTVDSLFEEEEALLTAHMNVIQENAELLTEEGRMLQQVQGESDYDIDAYVARLEAILDTKEGQIKGLRQRLRRFSDKLREEEDRSKLIKRMPMF